MRYTEHLRDTIPFEAGPFDSLTQEMSFGHELDDLSGPRGRNKVDAVREFQRPATKKHVCYFLGLTGNRHKFIPNYTSIALPSLDLIKECHTEVHVEPRE